MQAYHRGIYLPKYVLLTIGWYHHEWWKREDQLDLGENVTLTCTVEQREQVLLATLSTNVDDFLEPESEEDNDFRTSVGIVSSDKVQGYLWANCGRASLKESY